MNITSESNSEHGLTSKDTASAGHNQRIEQASIIPDFLGHADVIHQINPLPLGD